MKKQTKTSIVKRTFSVNQLPILIVQEAFKRDLPLFRQLITDDGGFFGQPFIKKDWTFTVIVSEDGERELLINVPQQTKK